MAKNAIVSYITNLARSIVGLPISTNPLFTGTSIVQFGSQEVYQDIDTRNAIKDGFDKNTAVYSIVMKDAVKFGSIPRFLYDASKKEEKSFRRGVERKAVPTNVPIENNALTDLLNRPNPYESQDEFFCKVRAFYKVCGEAFIWLNRDIPDGVDIYDDTSEYPVLEMYCISPEKIIIKPDPENIYSAAFYILESGTRQNIRRTDMIHWKATNLDFDTTTLEQLRGKSPLGPGAKTLEENNSMSKAAMRQAQNSGAKGAFINKTLGSKLSPTQKSNMDEAMNTKINNNDKAGSVAFFEGDWDYKQVGMSSIDLDLREGKKMTWQELCFLFDVPYVFFDPTAPWADKKEAQKAWVSNAIMPACKQLDGEMNRVLLKAFNLQGKAFIASDASDLPEMQIDIQAMATALGLAWWISPNEKLEMMGEEPVDDPRFDEPWVPQGITPLSESSVIDDMQATIDAMKINPKPQNNGFGGNGNGKVPAAAR